MLKKVTMMQTENNETSGEQVVLKKEQAYIRKLLGMEETDSISDAGGSTHEDYGTCDELDDSDSEKKTEKCPERTTSEGSSDYGYVSSSDEDKSKEKINNNFSSVVDLEDKESCRFTVKETIEKYNLKEVPDDVLKLLEGINQGMPYDYKPNDKKPDWLEMKKFKIGQTFAQKYYFGLNFSEMISLLIIFSFPDSLEPLIFTGKSSTPFTAFRRYLSTVLRVKSWFEHDIWSKDTLGYRNIKIVRAMHLNVSKRLNSIPYNELKSQLSLWGSSNEAAVWCPSKQNILEDFRSIACPFQTVSITNQRPGKVFVNQLEMSITQFGFLGLMITYPDKFGAANATEEELEGFVHLWRGIGYLLGIEDKYNFCNGTLEEVRKRCHYIINNVAKPSLQSMLHWEDWEHMCRCMVEGVSYYVPGVSFEVSLLYVSWVLGIDTPRLYSSLTWKQYFMFHISKFFMCFVIRLPGMLALNNWMVRRSINRANSMSHERLNKLESRSYSYETKGSFNTRL